MAGVSARGKIKVMSSPSCGLTLPKTWVYSRTRCVGTWGRQPKGAQQEMGLLIRPNRASSSNIRRKGRWGCPAATAATLAGSFFKSGPGARVVLGMFGARLHAPPLVPGQQPINGGVGDRTTHHGLVAGLDPARRDQLPGLSLLPPRCQRRLFLRHRQVLMASPAFGPSPGASQPAPQIVRPDAPDM